MTGLSDKQRVEQACADKAFQAALQRYAHANGSSMAIMQAAAVALANCDPDYVYDPDADAYDDGSSYPWADRYLVVDDSPENGSLKRFETFIQGPARWAARVKVGEDEYETQWFATSIEAENALIKGEFK